MRPFLRVCCLLLMAGTCALAQRSTFYWLADAGGQTAAGHTGFRYGLAGGGEIGIAKGFSAGPEMGFTVPSQGRFRDTIMGLGSLNGYYHPRYERHIRVDPFVTAGYAVLFRNESTSMFQYGGGMNYWVREDLAFRAEFRDRTWGGNPGRAHLWSFRFGVSFTHLFP